MILRLSGQARVIAGPDRLLHLGWDMTAALALAQALGLAPRLVAELLPEIEAAAMAALNDPEGALHADDLTEEDENT